MQPYRPAWLGVAALGIIAVLPCWNAHAQGVSAGPRGVKLNGFGQVDLEKTVDFWSDLEQSKSTEMIQLHIELIQQVCQLSEAETNKLMLAAKGVVSRRLASGRAQLTEFIYESDLVDRPTDALKNSKDYANKLRAFGAGKVCDGIVYLRTEFDTPVSEDPLWTNVLKSTLSDAQLETFQAFSIQRNASFLATAISLAITELDHDIFMSDGQKEELQEYFFELLRPQVTEVNPMTVTQARLIVRPEFEQIAQFENLIRSSQFERLKSLKQEQPRASVGWGSARR